MNRTFGVAVACALWAGAQVIPRPADPPSRLLIGPPSAGMLEVLSLGRDSVAVSALWSATVAEYATRRADPGLLPWVRSAIFTCQALDPRWAPPLVFGSAMLASLGDLDAHEAVLAAAADANPDVAWYPEQLAASRIVYRRDPDSAQPWIARADAIRASLAPR